MNASAPTVGRSPANIQLPIWRQLRWSLVLSSALIAIVPVLVVGIFVLSQTRSQTLNQVNRQLESVTTLKLDQLHRWLESGNQIIDVFLNNANNQNIFSVYALRADNTSNQSIINATLQNGLTAVTEEESVYTEFFLYDREGRVIASSNEALLGRVVRRQPYFEASLLDRYVQSPYYDVSSGELAMYITRPIQTSDGTIVGVLAGRLNLDRLGEIMTERVGLGETGETYLVSVENQYLITPSRFEGFERDRAYRSEGINQAIRGVDGYGNYPDYRGVPIFGVYRWVPELNAAFLTEIDEAEALSLFNQTFTFGTVIVGVAALIGVLVALYSANRVSRPITAMTQAASQIAAGDLRQRIKVREENEIGILASTFNSMAEQVQDLVGTLEDRIGDRTRDLQTIADVTAQVSTILDQDRLLQEVVDLTKESFSLYHAHIYLLDEWGRTLVLAAGAGQAGRAMKAQGRSIALNHQNSLVARAGRTRRGAIANDVTREPDFLPNPLLPNTRSEMALPMVVGDKLIGVLDVQADVVDRFSDEDVRVQSTLAGQIAVAIQNARAFTDIRTAQNQIQLYADVVNNSPVGMYVWQLENLDDARSFRMLAANSASAGATGVPPEAIIGKTMTEAFPTLFQTAIPETYATVVRTGKAVYLGEIQYQDENVAPSTFEVRAFPLPNNCVGISFENVTSRKAQQVEIEERAAEVETVANVGASIAANRNVDDLLWSVADLVKANFNRYYAHIYQFDRREQSLYLVAGAGDVGRKLVSRGHSIPLSRENSLVARAARSRQSVVINDVTRDPDFLPNTLLPDTKAEMAVPLVFGDELLGVLDIQDNRVNAFSDAQVQAQQVLANQIAVAIQNARAFDFTQRQVRNLELTSRIADIIRESDSELEFMLENIMSALADALGASTVIFTEWDNDQQGWHGMAGAGEGITTESIKQFFAPANQIPHAVESLRTRDVVAIDRVEEYPNFPKEYIEGSNLKSVLTLPIVVSNAFSGVVYLSFAKDYHYFSPDEIELGRVIANQISIGLERSLTETERQRSAALIRTVIDATPDWIFAKDQNFRYILANQSYATAIGSTPEVMIGKDDIELGFPAELVLGDPAKGTTGFRTDDVKVLQSGMPVYNPHDVAAGADGRPIVFETQKMPLRDADGQTSAVLGYAHNITERVQAQEEQEIVYQTASKLAQAFTREELLDALSFYTRDLGAASGNLLYVDLDDQGQPEWVEVVAEWAAPGVQLTGVGARYYLPHLPFSRTWISTPDRPLFISDVMTSDLFDEETRRLYAAIGTRGAMILPLTNKGQWTAIVTFNWSEPHQFTDRDSRVFSAVILQAAAAIDAARAYEETQIARAEAETLYVVGNAIYEAQDVKAIAALIARHAAPAETSSLSISFYEDGDFDKASTIEIVSNWQPSGADSTGMIIQLSDFMSSGMTTDPRAISVLNDTETDPRVDDLARAAYRMFNVRSNLSIPLIIGERLIGSISVAIDKPYNFTDRDVRIFRTVGEQVTTTLERLRLQRQTERRASEIETVAGVGAQVATNLDLNQLLWSVANLTKENFHRYYAHIYRYEAHNQTLVLAAGAGEIGEKLVARGHSIPLSRENSLVARAARSQQAVIINDVSRDPNFLRNELLPDTKSEMAVPIVFGDELLGVLDIQDDKVNAFTEMDAQAKTILGNQIGAAMQNARVFEQVQNAEEKARTAYVAQEQSRAETEVLYTLSNAIYEAQDVKSLAGLMAQYAAPAETTSLSITVYQGGDFETATNLEVVSNWQSNGLDSTGMIIPLSDFSGSTTADRFSIDAINDTETDPRVDEASRAAYRLYGTRANLSVPLAINDRLLGSISVSTGKPYYFTERDIRVFRSIAEQVTATLERIRLQQQMEKRAAELETVAEVSRSAAAILNVEELLHTVTELTKFSFSLYHAHVYLLDETGEYLQLTAGAGEPGRIMRERRHRIPVDHEHSLVAKAARTQKAVIVNDVRSESDFLPNPLLPETRSELAIPLIVANEVIGVMDVQSNIVNRFTEEDVRVKTTLADQIGVAVQNARAFQEQQRTAERLREVDRLKSQFLANMSHELRTPLNSIIGYAEVLLDGIDGELSDEAVEDVEAIHGGGKHLLLIINDILDLAKIEAGQMFMDRQEADVVRVIEEVVTTTGILAKNKGITLDVQLDDNIPSAYGDPIRLKQIVFNLVNNAIKFTERGGVTVHIGATEEDEIFVRVNDSGIGMTPDDMKGLFQQFHQVDGSATRRAGGTGLGLVITRHLVHMHQGEIYVESEKGVGSTFWFTVPVYVGQRAQKV